MVKRFPIITRMEADCRSALLSRTSEDVITILGKQMESLQIASSMEARAEAIEGSLQGDCNHFLVVLITLRISRSIYIAAMPWAEVGTNQKS